METLNYRARVKEGPFHGRRVRSGGEEGVVGPGTEGMKEAEGEVCLVGPGDLLRLLRPFFRLCFFSPFLNPFALLSELPLRLFKVSEVTKAGLLYGSWAIGWRSPGTLATAHERMRLQNIF